jgi:putative membrane protein (TIGR04086 family)
MMKAIVAAYCLTAVVLLILSFVMYKFKMSLTGANGGILFTYVISCMAGGFLFSGSMSGKRYLGGGAAGMVYFLVVYCVSALWNRSLAGQMPGLLTAFLVCLFAGMLGGMIRSGVQG